MRWTSSILGTFRNVSEREIDALLIEEIRCSAQFREFLLAGPSRLLGLAQLPAEGECLHSVHRSGEHDGQTDLLVRLPISDGCQVEIFIENKVAAPFSDRTRSGVGQIDRYLAHIAERCASGAISAGVLLICAPEAYLHTQALSGDGRFTTCSLEAIKHWFEAKTSDASTELAERFRHKALVLACAIAGHRRGYVPSTDARVTSLWSRYYAIASSEFADLALPPKSGEVPPDSYTAYFPCSIRQADGGLISLAHVWECGNCDALFRKARDRVADFSNRHAARLESGMSFRVAGSSLGVNVRVPPIRRFVSTAQQDEDIRSALRAVRQLKGWVCRHAAELV